MMKTSLTALVIPATVAALACSTAPDLGGGPTATEHFLEAESDARMVSVLSRNLYIGTDVDSAIAALASPDPSDDQAALFAAIQTFLVTDVSSRADALAEEIERTRPDVIGLQEVWIVSVNIPGFMNLQVDFLPLLESKLGELGLEYAVATRLFATHAELPGVQLTDTDAILFNPARVSLESADAQLFQYNAGDPGTGFEVVRGWSRMSGLVDGRPLQFLNAHLESGQGPLVAGLRALQALELLAIARTDVPVVLVGDLNDDPGSQMHQILEQGGFVDAWPALRAEAPGETCCHADDLSDRDRPMSQRIDYVMTRGFDRGGRTLQGAIRRLGYLPWELVPGPVHELWASDHLGLAARLIYP